MVLSSGHAVTCSVPIYDGYCLKHAVQRLDLCGEDLTEYCLKLLTAANSGNGYRLKRNDAQTIKETLCYVALDFDAELKKKRECVSYQLPDGTVLKIDSERFKTPEIMFDPQQIGLEKDTGIQHMVFDGVMQCDIDLRKDLLKNIVICGGNLMFDRMGKRLKKEVAALAANTLNCKVNVIESTHR